MTRLGLAITLVVGLTVGCGGTSDIGDRFPDDIDTSLTLDQIGESGLSRICSSFESWVREQYSSSYWVQAVCLAQAIEDNETASACADQVDECLDNPPAAVESLISSIQAQAGCGAVSITADGCTSTVGQIENCLDALSDALDAIQLTLTCAAAGEVLDDGWWMIGTPSACTEIESSCQ